MNFSCLADLKNLHTSYLLPAAYRRHGEQKSNFESQAKFWYFKNRGLVKSRVT